MGYTLTPANPTLKPFEFGAFSFPTLLDACGCLFPMAHAAGRWQVPDWNADPRLRGKNPDGSGSDYPTLLSGGFFADDEEARIMARMARNFVLIQRSLPEQNRVSDMRGKATFEREDMVALMTRALSGAPPDPWPVKVRDDFTDKIERFSTWAVESGGFHIGFTLTVNGENVARELP